MSIEQIANELFATKPSKTLFHYTSLGALTNITVEGGLHATDIHYFNDAAEMRHFMRLLHVEIGRRLELASVKEKVLCQFREWTSHRLSDGNMVFVTSFTENGNLLSQWRGYCPVGKGLSLGFSPQLVMRCAERQSFQVGKCIYDSSQQQTIVTRVIEAVITISREHGEAGPHKKHPTQSFHHVFEVIENTLLCIGALIKDPSFREEEEWRAVSPALTNYVEAPIRYREGTSMLIPSILFSLKDGNDSALRFEHVFVGPTPNVNLSMNSLSRFLAMRRVGTISVEYCGIPFRAW